MSVRRKNRKSRTTGYKITGILLMITSIILLGIILTSMYDMLPLKYLGIIVGGLLLFNLIVDFFVCRKKGRRKPKKFFSIVALLFSVLFLAISFFIYRTFGVLEDLTEDFKVYKYHVVVRDSSDYKSIKDIESKSLGYYNDNSEATKKALSTLNSDVSTKNDGYGNLESLGSDLLNKNVESVLVEDSQKTKLDNAGSSNKDNNSVKGFKEKTRIIKTYTIRLKTASDGVNVAKDVFNIYISGMDEYGTVSPVSRSDVNMLITVNPKTRQILLTNIPRDYYVQLHDTTGYKDKLTHAGNYGVDTSVATIEDLLGIKINYYVKVNFSSLVNIVNALGGVDVYSEYDFQSWNGYNFSKGYNSVNGKQALSFVRERKTFNQGDNQRGKNQQAMIEAIFRKCTSPSIIIKYNSLLSSLEDSMITNMPMKSIKKLAKMQLVNNAKWTITSNSLTGTGSMEYTYSYGYQTLYVTIPNDESVNNAKELIAKVTNGELLESSYDGDSSNVHSVSKSSVYKSSYSSTSTKTTKPKTTTVKKKTTKKTTQSSTVKQEQSNVSNNDNSTSTSDVNTQNSDTNVNNQGGSTTDIGNNTGNDSETTDNTGNSSNSSSNNSSGSSSNTSES